MSNYKKPSSEGDRIDIGGKLPQFDAFAWFVYKELIANTLEWIKIGDPKALTLDDIQYSTKSETHAYQVKWSNLEKPRPISFAEFAEMIPSLVTSWKALKLTSTHDKKKLRIFLLTNRPLSQNDTIVYNGETLGNSTNLYKQVWQPFKTGKSIDAKWLKKIEHVYTSLSITKTDFKFFCKDLEIITSFELPKFRNDILSEIQQRQDLKDLSRFIIDELANKKKVVHYSSETLIKSLRWEYRFKTTFQHDLIIDKQRYQPISETINELNEKIDKYGSGYIFLVGTPGTGKSTLINQWSKNRPERISRYYAFDFTNPSSISNHSERGEASNLFYDLIYQLQSSLSIRTEVLPFKSDLTYLINTFYKLLEYLHTEFINFGKKTIIIIDGLDHVPREYKAVTKTFLSFLPSPSSIPVGVIFILGSQSYELEQLSVEIKEEARKPDRKIQIATLDKKSVYNYIESSGIKNLKVTQKEKIFEKSEGHPLYLSYLIERIKSSTNIDYTISEFPVIEGYIDNYYKKIWENIVSHSELVVLLGLMARIHGSIKPQFVEEWKFDNVYALFRVQAVNLFDQSEDRWSFFHNSFRQFLIQNSAFNLLTGEFERRKDIDLHVKLVYFYNQSRIEPIWKGLFHLYLIGEYEASTADIIINGFDEFVRLATPESFIDQLLSYRPVDEIRQDITIGLKIAQFRKDVYLLTRFIFCSAELATRIDYLDPASFVKLYLNLGKNQIAKDYLHFENRLYCSKQFALTAARFFYDVGDKVEAKLLFMLSEPEGVLNNSIAISETSRFDELKGTLEEWVKTATLFYPIDELLVRLRNITFLYNRNHRPIETPEAIRIDLIYELCTFLISVHKWSDLDLALSEINFSSREEKNIYFHILYEAIEECLEDNEKEYVTHFLNKLLTLVDYSKCSNTSRIYVADILYKTTHEIELVEKWLKDVEQPKLANFDSRYDNRFALFIPKIKLNKLFNLLGRGISLHEAVPNPVNNKDYLIAELERMLFLITKLYTDASQNKPLYGNISKIVRPIIEFYYKDVHFNRDHWYEITTLQEDYNVFLIDAVSKYGGKCISDFASYIFSEFDLNKRFWNTSLKRNIIVKLFENGCDEKLCREQLGLLESSMLGGLDISGRVTECSKQAENWLKFNDNNRAEHWIKRAIQESIGIGYSKDYQFNTWIKWLQKINKEQPEKAKDRLSWFLSHLQFIKDTTESAYWDMSEELLRTTLVWDFVHGIEQLKWQLDNGLITFKDAMAITIEQSLSYCQEKEMYNLIIDLFIKILLPISNETHERLLNQICESGYQFYGKELFHSKIYELITAIRVLSIEENRKQYLQTISLFFKKYNVDVKEDIFEYNKKTQEHSHSSHEMNIVLKSTGERLIEKEVLSRVNSYHDLKKMLSDDDRVNSYFDWTNVIEKIAGSLSAEEIIELSTMYNSDWRKSFYLANLSRLALKLNEKPLAIDLANEAVNESKSTGWVKRYDGGTRVTAFKALISASKQEGHDKAFNVFSEDAIKTSYPGFYAEYLDDILQVISSSIDLPKIWKEIEGYLNRLMVNSCTIDSLPQFSDSNKSFENGMIELLLYLSKFPVPMINIEAQKILASLNFNNILVLEKVKNLSERSETEQELFINILLFLDIVQPSNLKCFFVEIKRLCLSENFFIRYKALFLIKKIDKNFQISFPYKELNPLYKIYLKPQIGFEINEEMKYTESVKDSDNVHHLLIYLDFHLQMLKDFTQIEISNFEYRIMAFIKETGNFYQMGSAIEKKIRWLLQEIKLNYSYHRPRALVAQNALMHVLTELLDSRTLNRPEILRYFDFTDYNVELLDEVEKPTFIQILDPENKHSFDENWINSIEGHERLNQQLSLYGKDKYVIGEYSLVRCLYWGLPTEKYKMQISYDQKDNNEADEKDFFQTFFHCRIPEYLKYPYGKPNTCIILNNHMFTQFDLKSKWIAFNPALARKLGWIPEDSKTFAWKNSKGTIMVESVFWRNGNIHMPAPQLHSEAGEGWLVVCSKDALDQIISLSSNWIIERKLVREVKNEGNAFSKECRNKIQLNLELSL